MSSLAELKERLALYREAERAILQGHQSYSIDNMAYSRVNFGLLQSAIRELEQQIAAHPDGITGGRFSHSSAVFGGRR